MPDGHGGLAMRDKLFDWTPGFAAQIIGAVAWCIRAALFAVAVAVVGAFYVLTVLFLRLLRPFIMWPLTLGMIGGVLVGIYFASNGMWHDAMRAGFVAVITAMIFAVYAVLVQMIDPEHFDDPVVIVRRWYD